MRWCHDPPPMKGQQRWAKTPVWWLFVSGKKSIGATNFPESSTI